MENNNKEPRRKGTSLSQCDCYQMSCEKGCTKNHTHKTFFCNVCQVGVTNYVDARTPEEREADSKIKSTVTYASTPPPSLREEWGEEFNDKIVNIFYTRPESGKEASSNAERVKDFIQSLLKSDRERIKERLNEENKISRKGKPLYSGLLTYFPDALTEVARTSKVANDQHNPGEPLHWAREKSTDQLDALMRHLADYARGEKIDDDGCYHLSKVIWRACAQLQLDLEEVNKE